ncbi:cupredoxin-like protein [Methylosinus sp. sav-2]|jgi:heme/copper-type cytochrome/quinol oxidase subunit 2|uniref:cupredoxin domain-containing protein n=1 Tax=unclassified Methylosinus TaxID=2624500 RepID=UPI000465A48B|nr:MULTISPECIES: cupredoxin domain-containing protein [unclassified Methylosinus]TDX66954.1 cupredoxin-like protein [Methylosinus sp. sav-2]
MTSSRILLVAAALAAGVGAAVAADETSLEISIKDHRFSTAELHAPADKPITIVVKNLDSTPEEFESKALKIEKVVAGKAEITVRVRPLKPGRYHFVGEYHEDTAKGELVVE